MQRTKAVWKTLAHRCPMKNVNISQLNPTLHFVGHYQEPPLTLNLNLTDGEKDVLVAFDPATGEWAVNSVEPWKVSDARTVGDDRDLEYGKSHRRYVVSKRQAQGLSKAEAEQKVEREFEEAKQRAERFSDEEARDRARNRAFMILKDHKKIQALRAEFQQQQVKATA